MYQYIHPLSIPLNPGSSLLYTVANGTFGISAYTQSGLPCGEHIAQWLHCRERFHAAFFNKVFYYAFSAVTNPDVLASMIARTEMLLNLSPLHFSSVHECVMSSGHDNRAICVKISDFWTAYTARRHFFSLMLRAAMRLPNVDSDIIAAYMGEESYSRPTARSVALFLGGYTCTVNKEFCKTGWVANLYGQTGYLMKPTNADERVFYRNGDWESNLSDGAKSALVSWVKQYDKNKAAFTF